MPIGVNLTSNVVRVFCLAMKTRSPGAPRIVAGDRVFSFVPLFKATAYTPVDYELVSTLAVRPMPGSEGRLIV
jgi:hypothetical protein